MSSAISPNKIQPSSSMRTAAMKPDTALAAKILCQDHFCIEKGESVLILVDTETDMSVAEAVFEAAATAGAQPSILVIPQLPFQGALADPYVPSVVEPAVTQCDVWFDLTFPYLAGSHVHDCAMKAARARYVLLGDLGASGLARLYGHVDFDRLFDVQLELDRYIAGATGKRCRVRNAAGTDVSFTLAKPATEKLRHANRPGSQTVPGSSLLYPDPETVRGVIVVEAAFHEFYTHLPAPMRIEVDGKIRGVAASGTDRAVMERALKRAGKGDFGYVIHFTHGFHPAARFAGTSFIEDIRVAGNNAIGLGLPWWIPGGGENHPDAVVTRHSIWIDDELVVDDGRIVAPAHVAAAARELHACYPRSKRAD
jgi:hypothetical protein